MLGNQEVSLDRLRIAMASLERLGIAGASLRHRPGIAGASLERLGMAGASLGHRWIARASLDTDASGALPSWPCRGGSCGSSCYALRLVSFLPALRRSAAGARYILDANPALSTRGTLADHAEIVFVHVLCAGTAHGVV